MARWPSVKSKYLVEAWRSMRRPLVNSPILGDMWHVEPPALFHWEILNPEGQRNSLWNYGISSNIIYHEARDSMTCSDWLNGGEFHQGPGWSMPCPCSSCQRASRCRSYLQELPCCSESALPEVLLGLVVCYLLRLRLQGNYLKWKVNLLPLQANFQDEMWHSEKFTGSRRKSHRRGGRNLSIDTAVEWSRQPTDQDKWAYPLNASVSFYWSRVN